MLYLGRRREDMGVLKNMNKILTKKGGLGKIYILIIWSELIRNV